MGCLQVLAAASAASADQWGLAQQAAEDKLKTRIVHGKGLAAIGDNVLLPDECDDDVIAAAQQALSTRQRADKGHDQKRARVEKRVFTLHRRPASTTNKHVL